MDTTYTEITSLFDYLESKQSTIMEMMEKKSTITIEPKHQDRNPEAETAEDWAKIQGGMSMNQAARDRGIGRSQIRRRLVKFGYKKKPVAKFA